MPQSLKLYLMTSQRALQPGDTVDIGGTPVTLGARRSVTGIRWTWDAPGVGVTGDATYVTARDAITAAARKLGAPACRHGQRGWCPTCHDQER